MRSMRSISLNVGSSRSGFLDMSIDTYKNYLAGIGLVSASWAAVELYLDFCIELMLNTKHDRLKKEKMPRTFNPKALWLKKFVPILQEPPGLFIPIDVANRLPGFVERAEKLSKRRNRMLHAAAIKLVPGELRSTVTKYTYDEDGTRETFELKQDDFTEFGDDATTLMNQFAALLILWNIDSAGRARLSPSK